MRAIVMTLAGLSVLAAGSSAEAKINITVNKDTQTMTVVQDGVEKYRWPVSSGIPSYETPNGSFQTFRMEEDHFSKEFDDAPMPHAIFFTKKGHAIHGTDSVNRLGSPASHGCVRLSRENAATLFAMVKADGVLNTNVTLTGSSQVALARNPRGSKTAVARREVAPAEPTYDAYGNPMEIAPQAVPNNRRVIRQAQPSDNRYIYPADGDDGRQYPAPPGYRRMTEAETQQYYANRSYYNYNRQPQVYYAPRQRGFFGDY
ncbi:L,D-transpeptidase [Rhodopseudomonas boonkerdii]|uniref:L,D-transpeptidase family protein n=1 Tax=Rhodopseudomonas boonkerdii TaxID=475937 RepID=UPI001E5B68ED|nr:L,D-transpeptidase family protein [Rhodopseudomonas boonkerdii]UGV25774.1 L,D-transpeptidase [Rhodopseudomonas boonkerdii]